jgi:hypothetical protein
MSVASTGRAKVKRHRSAAMKIPQRRSRRRMPFAALDSVTRERLFAVFGRFYVDQLRDSLGVNSQG